MLRVNLIINVKESTQYILHNSFPETITGVNLIIEVNESTLYVLSAIIIAHTYLQVCYRVDIDKFSQIHCVSL